jgi:protoporphyrinogen oxidase
MARNAIIGAGPMGLVCALELLKRGESVDIFENDDRIGGMSASFDFDGLAIERFYHFIVKTDHPLFTLLDELGIADKLRWTDTRMGFYCDGRLYPWGTPQALLRFDKLGWIDKVRYALHVLYTKNIRDWTKLDGVSASSWLKQWLGERAYRVLWQRLFDLKFYEYSDQLSAAWLGTRIKRVALSRRGLTQESLGFIDGGSQTLLDALRTAIETRGGKVHLRSAVQRVVVHGGRTSGVIVAGAEHAFERVISTVPIQYIPRLVPDLPPEVAARIGAIENIPVVCVVLKLRRRLTDNFWMNISDPSIDVPGVIEYSNLNPGAGPAIVYAPFYMPKSHPKFARGNDEFIEEVLGYLPRLNPEFQRDWIMATHCHRYDFAQTISPPGFSAMLPPMRTPIGGLFMADTSYYYPEDRSISESAAVARRLADLVLATKLHDLR